uniref:Peptidase S1 domain-containing protein n=1 Tax=Anopheles coluzzii TaxID=1518534 RepID=A0A6E8W4X7_ANOCL
MKSILYVVRLVKFFCVLCACDFSCKYFMPYERTSIDDCNLRYILPPSSKSLATAIGNPSKPGEFSAIAAIGWIKPGGTVNWNCGGSLIWANFILTAAHCTKDRDTLLPPDVIRIGDLNLYDDREDALVQERTIIRVIRHPLYNTSSVFYDIALLMLNEKVNIYFEVMPTCLWLDDNIPFSKVEAAGWGTSGFGYGKTNILIKAELKLMANKDCESYYSKVASVKNGLIDHQLCAWDKVMDTCPGDSGGPLQHKLIFGDYKVPFLVGVTSFGLSCGNSQPGVYVKVSKFGSWIVETLQQHGERVTAAMFEPLACAGRYFYHRERYGPSIFDIRPHNVQLIWPKQPSPERCSGLLTEPDAVLTTAQCVTLYGTAPTHVKLHGSEVIGIEEIVVHENYTGNLLYNNIAILKLNRSSLHRPDCIEYDMHPLHEIKLFAAGILPQTIYFQNNGERMTGMIDNEQVRFDVSLYENMKCNLSSEFQNKHYCFGVDEFIVPGSCDLLLGGPIEATGLKGMNIFGNDCGFGKPAVALNFVSHKSWLESVILPTKSLRDKSINTDTETDMKFECYGYLIRTRGVVTAASCLRLRSSNPTIVRLGEQGWTNSHLIFRLIEATTVHPRYNETTGEHDIAVIKLKEAIHPFVHLFPVCLWQNTTHSPVHQAIMHSASGVIIPIHPMYNSDCEKRLNRSFTIPGMGCMHTEHESLIVYDKNECLKMQKYKNLDCNTYGRFKAGNPIIWREYNKTGEASFTEFLINIYNYGDCVDGFPLHIVHHIAFYVEWFARVLQ